MRSKTNLLLLDTHTLLWAVSQAEELSSEVKKNILQAQEHSQLLLASISLWEIAMLQHKKRVCIYEPIQSFLKKIAQLQGLSVIDISPEIAAESVSLMSGFHGDPADRIIVATARVCNATLLTRDHKILSWAALGNMRSMQI